MDELDALLADLAGPAPPKAAPPKPAAAAPKAEMDDLDALLADLAGTKPAAPTAKPSTPAKPTSPPSQKKPPTSASTVDDLLASLTNKSAPPPKKETPKMATTPAAWTPAVNGAGGSVKAAAAASDDLDDIMASLNDMKVSSKPHTSAKSGVDDVLNSLSGLSTSSAPTKKGSCFGCKKPLVGQLMACMGHDWHVACFTCFACRQRLTADTFFEHEGLPYCEKDYYDQVSSRCAYCNGVIEDTCITALGRTWHPDHFFCSQCGKTFPDGAFMEKDGKAYCEEDYYLMYAPKCGGCSKAVMDACVNALGTQWHPQCFVCRTCKKPFEGQFFEHEGQPYCETHFHQVQGTLCHGCQKPLSGKCVTATGGKRFHPDHFICQFCKKKIANSSYKEEGGKYFCSPCHVKLFG